MTAKAVTRTVVAAICLAATAPAQDVLSGARQTPEQERRELVRRREQNDQEVQRLLELRLRHDLGLLGELDDAMVRTGEPSTSSVIDRRRAEVDEENAKTQILQVEYERLRKAVDRLRTMAAANTVDEQPGELLTVPSAGSRMGGDGQPGRRRSGWQPAAPGPETAPSSEAADRQPAIAPQEALTLDPLRAQIHGSRDHSRVAQALYRAGQALMERAAQLRRRDQGAVAADLDARGRERLLRALDELKPLLEVAEPGFATLFYLGRCRELLFRYSERYDGLSVQSDDREYRRREQEVREPFLQISARDVQKPGEVSGVEVLGMWGQAAKSAMEHFRWMNINAGYDAHDKIEALTWPGLGREGGDGR